MFVKSQRATLCHIEVSARGVEAREVVLEEVNCPPLLVERRERNWDLANHLEAEPRTSDAVPVIVRPATNLGALHRVEHPAWFYVAAKPDPDAIGLYDGRAEGCWCEAGAGEHVPQGRDQ
jgi:hypothetical protein